MTLAALAVLLGVSCTEMDKPGDEGWTELGGDRPVLFHSSLATLATKSTLPDGTFFGVFAFYQAGTPGNSGTWSDARIPNFLFNQQVQFQLPDTYTYLPTRYWPSNDYNTLTFWAYYPYTAFESRTDRDTPDFLVANSTDPYINTSAGIPDILFTSDGQDLMVSDRVENQTYTSNTTNNGVVPLTFNHVLSKIDVKAMKVDPGDFNYTVILKSVSFIGLYRTATLTLRSNIWGWQDFSGARQEVWSVTPSPSPELSSDNPTDLGSAILIPQDLRSDDSRLHVEYTVSYTDNGTTHTYTQTREAYLRDVFYDEGRQKWTKNTHYTLILQITPGNPIKFTVNWSDWGDVHNYTLSS